MSALLTRNQTANARGIIAAVKKRDWPQKAAIIAVETALTESGMRVIASANVHASQAYPHDLLSWTGDGLGHDHASMGMFQQQTGYAWADHGYGTAMNQTTMDSPNGWGTPTQLMNAELSTEKFLNALARTDWRNLSNWAAAQSVQGSAFADGSNYQRQDAQARAIVTALWADVSQETEMATIYRTAGHYPVLIDGASRTVLTDHTSVANLLAAGAKQVTVAGVDYNRIRKGAVL